MRAPAPTTGGVRLARVWPPLVLVALSLLVTAGRGVSTGDETWFLQVAARLADGEQLYDEVFYSPLPLAALLAAVPVAVVGAQIAVIEILNAITWAATALVGLHVARRAGVRGGTRILLLCSLLATATPQRNSLYTPLAMLLLMIALALVMQPGRPAVRAGAAGLAAGLAFASKQTIGLAALAALIVTVAACATGERRRIQLAAAAAGFGAVVLALVAGLAATGVLPDAIRSGFTSKGEYVEHGTLWYPTALEESLRLVASSTLGGIENTAPLLAAPLAVALVGLVGLRRSTKRGLVVLIGPAAFALAAVAAAFPRFGTTHLAWANPPVLVAAAVALTLLRPPRWIPAVLGAAVGGAALALLLQPVLAWARGDVRFVDLPGYRGVPLGVEAAARADRLRATTPSRARVLYVEYDAAFRYLVTGARNPTPWDVPAASNIGVEEIRRIRDDVSSGRYRICLAGAGGYGEAPSLRPEALEAVVRRTMRRQRDLGTCTLYGK